MFLEQKTGCPLTGSDGQEFLVENLDDFKVERPNGMHQCIVTEVLGPSIGADIEEIYGKE